MKHPKIGFYFIKGLSIYSLGAYMCAEGRVQINIRTVRSTSLIALRANPVYLMIAQELIVFDLRSGA